jgi:hypothetical protein
MRKDTSRKLAHDEGSEVPALIVGIPASVQQRGFALGIVEAILAERQRIKRTTIANRRLQHQLQAA